MELATRGLIDPAEHCSDARFVDVRRMGANDWCLAVVEATGDSEGNVWLAERVRSSIATAARRTFMPSRALAEVNATLMAARPPGTDDLPFSVFLARLEHDLCGAWVTLATAGAPRPVVVRQAGWIDVRGDVAAPVGKATDFSTGDDRVGLGPGDTLVACTRGITATRAGAGEPFGRSALPDVLLGCVGQPATRTAERIMVAVSEFAPGRVRDEAGLLVMRVPESAAGGALERVAEATEIPASELRLPGYPVGDDQPDLWKQRPRPPREARMRLAPEPVSIPLLRRLLTRLLRSWRMDELGDGKIELLATEVATSAFLRAVAPITVIVRYLGPVIRIEIGDGSPALPRQPAPNLDDLRGHGLMLVEALASAWGGVTTRTGRRLWFEVDADRTRMSG